MAKFKEAKDQSLERKFLGGLISNGEDVWIDISDYVSEKEFTHSDTKMLFRVCKLLLEDGNQLNSAIISSRCQTQGLTIKDGKVGDYIENLLLAPLNKQGTLESAKELIMLRHKRDGVDNARDVAQFINDFEGTNLSEFVSGKEAIFAECNDIIFEKHEPVNIAECAYDIVEEWGNKPSYIIKSPWKEFNEAFGGFEPKEAYCFAGRPAHGKSALMLSLAHQCANEIEENFIDGKPLPVLYLDTEMTMEQQVLRWAALVADINPHLIKSGKWRRNKECVEKIRRVLKDKSKTDNFHHVSIMGISTMEIRSIIRRWHRKTCGLNNHGIVVFDYLKLSGGELKGANNPRLEFGYKLDVVKDEIRQNTNLSLLFGAQRNRHGEDDDSSIAESDHIQQLSSMTALIVKKTMAELQEQPKDQFGTHKLIPTKFGRASGEKLENFENPVYINKNATNNWINLDFSNFRFPSRGDGRAVKDYMELS